MPDTVNVAKRTAEEVADLHVEPAGVVCVNAHVVRLLSKYLFIPIDEVALCFHCQKSLFVTGQQSLQWLIPGQRAANE